MIDVAFLYVKAGNGGNGSVHFRREKYIPKGGPDGGDGGNGGHVTLRVNSNLRTLDYFASHQKFKSESGEPGRKRKSHGANGKDLVLEVPQGTVVWKYSGNELLSRHEVFELLKQIKQASNSDQDTKIKVFGELVNVTSELLVANGGKGGRGNFQFRSSTNQAPMEAEQGTLGEEHWLILELKLLADIGLVGLPNAGKSTLLSVLTKARPKIANYPFTTLEPNLGVMSVGDRLSRQHSDRLGEVVIADIPGLIEGASQGKGLGDEFLRHVERCKALVHVVGINEELLQLSSSSHLTNSAGYDNIDPKGIWALPNELANLLWSDYSTIRKELKDYGAGLDKKPEIVVVNKIDLIAPELQDKFALQITNYFRDKGIADVLFVSAATLKDVDPLKKLISDVALTRVEESTTTE